MLNSGLLSAAFLVCFGYLVVNQKCDTTQRTVVWLVVLISTLLAIYASYYYYLASKREFLRGMSRLDAFEYATSNLTNAGLQSSKPVTLAARVLVLSQGVVDWIFALVIIAIAVVNISDGLSKNDHGTNDKTTGSAGEVSSVDGSDEKSGGNRHI